MGRITYRQEISSAVAPSRLFNAFFVYADNVLPKIVPQWIESVELIQGDGGVGSIEKTNFGESSNIRYAKYKIDSINFAKFSCKYTMIESDIMFDEIDKIEKLVKFVAAGSGCACKMVIEYHVEEGCDIPQADIVRDKDRAVGLFRAVEEYLLANPNFLGPNMLFLPD